MSRSPFGLVRASLTALVAAASLLTFAKAWGAEANGAAAVLDHGLGLCAAHGDVRCVTEGTAAYFRLLSQLPPGSPARAPLAAAARYYAEYAIYLGGDPGLISEVAARPPRDLDRADTRLFLRHVLLRAAVQLRAGDRDAAEGYLNESLALLASIRGATSDRATVAWALSDAIDSLMVLGDTQRALGIYRTAAPFITANLPPISPEALAWRQTEAGLLQAVGDLKGAERAADQAIGLARRVTLPAAVTRQALDDMLTLKAAACATRGDQGCARAALVTDPWSENLDAAPTAYLAARTFVLGPDSATARILRARQPGPGMDDLYRRVGLALALPEGPGRDQALKDAGRRFREDLRQPSGAPFAAWRRPGAIDRIVITLILSAASDQVSEGDFALMQFANRRGPAFDADDLALMSRTPPATRPLTHRALRLRAYRDRLERVSIGAALADSRPPDAGAGLAVDDVRHDLLIRADAAIDRNARAVRATGTEVSGAGVSGLAAFQAVLRPGEAALSITGLASGKALAQCIRRDRAAQRVVTIDADRISLDSRLLQAALTAGHAPSEVADSQFPVAAAMRLYDGLIRPFDDCLKPGDTIVWLPDLTLTAVPLAVLLEEEPPRQGRGYDLARANWLLRRHPLVYAGSAAVILAARTALPGAPTARDFLGIGDPVLDKARFPDLPGLPETADELRASAQGFSHVTLLTGPNAREGELRAADPAAFRYLSFATHGLLRRDLNGVPDPALLLTAGSGAPDDDGLLTASEIADLDLNARFVALSACNTANADQGLAADQLPALSSAFAVAGTPSTLATLWPVDSETSRRIVAGTFAGLRAGMDSATALAEAQRAFLQDPPGRAWLHPRFWAPFVLLGDAVLDADQATAAARSTPVSTRHISAARSLGETGLAITPSIPQAR